VPFSEKPRSGVVSFVHHRRPGSGTGDRPVTGSWFFVKIPSVTMTNSETEDDGWEQWSRDEEQSEEGVGEVQEVQTSGSRASTKSILRFPERNDEDTLFWTHTDETKPVSDQNKFKSEDMARVRQRKEILWTEVVKNDPNCLVDRWFRDHTKADRWESIYGVFPQGGKCSPNHKGLDRGWISWGGHLKAGVGRAWGGHSVGGCVLKLYIALCTTYVLHIGTQLTRCIHIYVYLLAAHMSFVKS
jgi:hypothetical protein